MKLKQRRERDSTLRRGIVCEGKYICARILWSVRDESREELVKPAREAHWAGRREGGGESVRGIHGQSLPRTNDKWMKTRFSKLFEERREEGEGEDKPSKIKEYLWILVIVLIKKRWKGLKKNLIKKVAMETMGIWSRTPKALCSPVLDLLSW